jgi:uncharacterized protein
MVGKQVVMWLSSEGVRLGLRGSVDPIRTERDPPVKRVHDQFIGRPPELQGATALMQFASDGATTFNYDDAARRPLACV